MYPSIANETQNWNRLRATKKERQGPSTAGKQMAMESTHASHRGAYFLNAFTWRRVPWDKVVPHAFFHGGALLPRGWCGKPYFGQFETIFF